MHRRQGVDADEFARRVAAELDACAVGRENSVHRQMLEGRLQASALRILAVQQYAFHAVYPSFLARVAAGSPDRGLRAALLRDAFEQDREPGRAGRCTEWAAVASAWGLSEQELTEGQLLPTTETMLAVQEYVAGRPFGEAFAGLVVAVNGEALPYIEARREAMIRHYGVQGDALRYFGGYETSAPDAVLREWIAVVARYSVTAQEQEAALRALRLVLHARWRYFDGIGAAAGGVSDV